MIQAKKKKQKGKICLCDSVLKEKGGQVGGVFGCGLGNVTRGAQKRGLAKFRGSPPGAFDLVIFWCRDNFMF